MSTCLQALPRKAATPLLHETLAWHGFQLEQQPSSCQEVPAWLKRMRDRELAMPICPGLLPPGWIEAQGLIVYPGHPPLQETLWLLLPEGRVLGSATARHLIRILRQRVEKAQEEWMPAQTDAAQEGEAAKANLLRQPEREQTESYAARASIRPPEDADSSPNGASTLVLAANWGGAEAGDGRQPADGSSFA